MRSLLPLRAARLATALVAMTVGLSACSSSLSSTQAGSGSGGNANTLAGTFQPPAVTIQPADKATAVAPDTMVTVKASGGDLDSVVVHVVGDTTPLPGTLTSNKRTWTATIGLTPGAQYQVDATATGPDGNATTTRSSFGTLAGQRLTTTASPGDGQTVGVGMPIKLRFNTAIPADQQFSLVSHLQVVSNPPVTGAWHWFSPYEVHYRPQDFWPAHTTVTLNANLQGINAGNNTWGFSNWSQSFTIGEKQISYIDNNTHQMQVYQNDKLLNIWGVSLGKAGFDTIGGTLVVLYHQQAVKMDSCATFGGAACNPSNPNYYSDYVYWDSAISTDGFFIHAAPWSVYAQGSYNVSHGCVNLSTSEATQFYQFSQVGDVVIIKNTARVADAGDGEGDWQIPFDQFANSGGAPTTTPPVGPAGGI